MNRKKIVPASKEHEKNFRKTFRLKAEFQNNPECIAAFEYAATTKLYIDEMNYIGAVTERKEQDDNE
jgi:hypothetical protein